MIAHVWNTTPDADTDITPFQAEHGMPCRSMTESILQQPPAEGLPVTADDLRSITVSVNAVVEHMKNVREVVLALCQDYVNFCGESKNYVVAQQLSCFAGME